MDYIKEAKKIYESYFAITPEDLTNEECVKFAKQCALIDIQNRIDLLNESEKELSARWLTTSCLLIQKKRFDLEKIKSELEHL